MITASGLTKYYGDKRAISDLDFEIEKGEIIGFLGLNGAGKTTTLKVLACLLLPSAGTVKVNGHDVTEEPHQVRKLVGFLPESPPLYTEMTVRSFLQFAAQLRGVDRERARTQVGEALELTNLQSVADLVIGTLSHGFRQRVGIAQALVHDPDLLILDEPIKGLDPVQIVEIRGMIRNLRGKHTILLSSHILTEISQTCDRLMVIKDGEIADSGTEEELTSRLGKGMRLSVTARGSQDSARDLLMKLDDVKGCQSKRAEHVGDNQDTFALTVTTSGDCRAEVAKALVEAGFGLLQLDLAEAELESAFLALTGSGAKADETPKKANDAKADESRARHASSQDAAASDDERDEVLEENTPAAADEEDA
jgi:ABC-2 type transport system ATP-binding protein